MLLYMCSSHSKNTEFESLKGTGVICFNIPTILSSEPRLFPRVRDTGGLWAFVIPGQCLAGPHPD